MIHKDVSKDDGDLLRERERERERERVKAPEFWY